MAARRGPGRRRAPAGLGVRGRAFWRSALATYDFSPPEFLLLEEACRCLDRLELLDGEIRERGATVEGSKGQDVVNPALAAARGQQATLHRLIAALRLPDLEGQAVATGREYSAAAAARARWAGPRQAREGS